MTTDDLVYAAVARCMCGAGMAFVRHDPLHQAYWDCSEILLQRANMSIHHSGTYHLGDLLPENHPQAYGHTTRPRSVSIKAPMKLVASESMAERIQMLEQILGVCSEFIRETANFTQLVVMKYGKDVLPEAKEFSSRTEALVKRVQESL